MMFDFTPVPRMNRFVRIKQFIFVALLGQCVDDPVAAAKLGLDLLFVLLRRTQLDVFKVTDPWFDGKARSIWDWHDLVIINVVCTRSRVLDLALNKMTKLSKEKEPVKDLPFVWPLEH